VLAALVFLGGSALALAKLVTDRESGGDAATPTVPAQPQGPVTDQQGGLANPPVSVAPAPSSTAPSTTPSASATAPPFTSGVFEMSGDVVELDLTVSDLGGDLVAFSTPDGSGLKPRASVDGTTVKLVAQADGGKGSGKIEVRLNERVAWGLRMTGGISNGSFALTGADLRGIDLQGGAAKLAMALPSRKDTLPIRMSGGVNTWIIATAKEVPVKVLLRKGGGEVTLNGHRTRGVDKGTTLRDKVDDSDSGGLDIEAVAALGTLIVGEAGDDQT
jgi:hypothetical protein